MGVGRHHILQPLLYDRVQVWRPALRATVATSVQSLAEVRGRLRAETALNPVARPPPASRVLPATCDRMSVGAAPPVRRVLRGSCPKKGKAAAPDVRELPHGPICRQRRQRSRACMICLQARYRAVSRDATEGTMRSGECDRPWRVRGSMAMTSRVSRPAAACHRTTTRGRFSAFPRAGGLAVRCEGGDPVGASSHRTAGRFYQGLITGPEIRAKMNASMAFSLFIADPDG